MTILVQKKKDIKPILCAISCKKGDFMCNKDKKWYVSNYQNLDYIKSYQDRDFNVTKREVSFILDNIKLNKTDLVVDVCCAGGRHLHEFARRGYKNLIGIDLSKELLNYAQKISDNLEYPIKYFQRDMRNLKGLKAKIITNLFSSFGFFNEDSDNFAFFSSVYNALDENGYFVFELFLKPKCFDKKTWSEDGDSIILKEQRFDDTGMRLIRKTTVFDKNNNFLRSERISTMREFEHDELFREIQSAGFNIVSEYENYKGKKFIKGESKRLLIIATKKETS